MCRVGAPWGHRGLCESPRLPGPWLHSQLASSSSPLPTPALSHVLHVTRSLPPPARGLPRLLDASGPRVRASWKVPRGGLGQPHCFPTSIMGLGSAQVSARGCREPPVFVLWGRLLCLLDKPGLVITSPTAPEKPSLTPRGRLSGICFFPYCLPATLGRVRGRA